MENKNRERLKMLSLTALFAALIVVCSWISVPFNVISFTMQTFAVFFALSFLGGKYGTLAVAVYIAVGTAGLPVFSGFRGGVGALTGATGGYIFGFLLSGAVYILFTLKKKTPAFEIAGLFAGLFSCYTAGTLWYYFIYLGTSSAKSISSVFLVCVVPYIIPDCVKLFAAYFLSKKLKTLLKFNN